MKGLCGVGGTLRTGLVERNWGILWAGHPCRDERGTSRDSRDGRDGRGSYTPTSKRSNGHLEGLQLEPMTCPICATLDSPLQRIDETSSPVAHLLIVLVSFGA